MENNLRLRIEKVSFRSRTYPIHQEKVKMRRKIYMALKDKQERAEEALILNLVEAVSADQ